MTFERFLDLTPRYFQALVDRQRGMMEREHEMVELMGAQIVAMVANTGFKGWEKPREVKEFMPSEWQKRSEQPAKPRRRSRQEIADEFRGLMAAAEKRRVAR